MIKRIDLHNDSQLCQLTVGFGVGAGVGFGVGLGVGLGVPAGKVLVAPFEFV